MASIEKMVHELELLGSNLDVLGTYITDARTTIDTLAEQLRAALRAVKPSEQVKPPTPSVDEYIAQATSATAIWKALEPEYKLDRRTLLARVERVVKAYDLEQRFPFWSTDLKLARYLAERVEGKRRLDIALEGLKAGAVK